MPSDSLGGAELAADDQLEAAPAPATTPAPTPALASALSDWLCGAALVATDR
jgi:hypothetical protein